MRTLEALGARVLVIRHAISGAPYLVAREFRGAVVNAGDGRHAHPTQALLDLYTLLRHVPGGSLAGRKVVILGDVLHSRVARSNLWTLTAAGRGCLGLRAGDAPPRVRGLGFGRARRRTSLHGHLGRRGHAPGRGRGDGAPAPEGADGRGPAAVGPRVRRPVRAHEERLALAAPGCLVLHPGPMNEGVEIAPGRGRVAPGRSSPSRSPTAFAIRMAVLALSPRRRPSDERRDDAHASWARWRERRRPRADLSGALDRRSATGRSGPADARRPGRPPRVRRPGWTRRGRGDGRSRRHRAPGFLDLHAHLREPGNEAAETIAQRAGGGGARRVHGRLRDAQHDAADRQRGGSFGRRSPRRPRPARPSGSCRSAPPRPVGRGSSSRRSASSPTPASVGFSDDGAPIQATGAVPQRPRLRRRCSGVPLIDHPEDPAQTAGAEANDGLVATVLGLARLARRRPRRTPSPATSPLLAEVVRDVAGRPTPPDPPLDRGVDRPRPARQGGGPAGDVRRDAAPPRPDRRVARRRPALGVGGARRRRHGARPVARRRDRGATLRRRAPGQPAAALAPSTRGLPGRRSRTARSMPSPPTTRRTPRSTRPSSSGWRKPGIAGIETALGLLLEAIDAG